MCLTSRKKCFRIYFSAPQVRCFRGSFTSHTQLIVLAYSSVPTSKKRKVQPQPEDDEDEVDQDGDDRKGLAVLDGANLDEEELLKMYNEKSGRQCFKDRPDIFTTKGKFKREYAYIAAGNKKPKLGGPGGSNGRITNRPWVKVIDLNGHQIQCGLVGTTALPYSRIVLVFPRASGAPPTYGLLGMFERGAVAGRAFVALEPSAPAMIISIPRAQVASKWPMSNTGKEEGTKLVEMMQTLDASPSGMRIDLVSIGIDGLTTDVASFSWLYEKWGSRVDIRLVFIVPAQFPGPVAVFPARPNGIRYGTFALADVAAAANNSPSTTDSSAELVRIIKMLRDKEDSVLLPVPNRVFSFTDLSAAAIRATGVSRPGRPAVPTSGYAPRRSMTPAWMKTSSGGPGHCKRVRRNSC